MALIFGSTGANGLELELLAFSKDQTDGDSVDDLPIENPEVGVEPIWKLRVLARQTRTGASLTRAFRGYQETVSVRTTHTNTQLIVAIDDWVVSVDSDAAEMRAVQVASPVVGLVADDQTIWAIHEIGVDTLDTSLEGRASLVTGLVDSWSLSSKGVSIRAEGKEFLIGSDSP